MSLWLQLQPEQAEFLQKEMLTTLLLSQVFSLKRLKALPAELSCTKHASELHMVIHNMFILLWEWLCIYLDTQNRTQTKLLLFLMQRPLRKKCFLSLHRKLLQSGNFSLGIHFHGITLEPRASPTWLSQQILSRHSSTRLWSARLLDGFAFVGKGQFSLTLSRALRSPASGSPSPFWACTHCTRSPSLLQKTFCSLF